MMVVNVQQMLFGCGRLGVIVWLSSIALAALLSRPYNDNLLLTRASWMVEGRRVLKLGSGCGLPLIVMSMLGTTSVLATDHWEEGGHGGGKEDEGSRLMPKSPHSMNLVHNLIPLEGIGHGGVPATSVRSFISMMGKGCAILQTDTVWTW